eukprot:CAMPEP_0197032506 /NCGR_PEP_ID=MMETSP1384-20130603/11173_1 /TAXON_ID=29189 /ORGANISM="Ammonia sp." /LENGTH=572 /DNA_ID=CAMNT_0042462185 /DNA_START=75 /DNA_END=1790 /DNA_ORIENTATION=+
MATSATTPSTTNTPTNADSTQQTAPKEQPKPFHSKSHYIQKYELNSSNFEAYYTKQAIITDPNEWQQFLTALRTELPISWRFNPSSKLHNIYKQKLLDDAYNLAKAEEDEVTHEGLVFQRPYPLSFYPNQNGWQCNFPKRFLNKHKDYFQAFRDFLVECNETGIISRQETVSMVPGLFLAKYLKPSDYVLDMCAAPGNKTALLMELLDYDFDGKWRTDAEHSGFIFANDADEKRAHVMVHQLKRIGINKFVVTNKLAQCIPRLVAMDGKTKHEFDNILCDVPCSSDGTLRKSPDLWKKWTVAYGNGLHTVQLSILIHALHLLKPGGAVVYSTCTFNPIENEAVIASALLKLNHYYSKRDDNGEIVVDVELVDASQDLPELKRNPGLQEWYVWDKKMDKDGFAGSYEEVAENRKKFVKKTMFMPQTREKCQEIKDKVMDYLQLQRCMRFLPHFHDTGGFFVAVLRKKQKPGNDKNTENDGDKAEDVDVENQAQVDEEKKDDKVDEGMLDDESLFNIEKREFSRKNIWNDNIPYFRMDQLANYQTELETLVKFYGLKIKTNDEKKTETEESDDA